MSKSVEAFRTIGEVAAELDVPKHVLRFWEGKFNHIRPMKRGGGRRYYRPEDMDLLRGIRNLLHAEGYTIKGVQKILREQGIEQVKSASIAVRASGPVPRRTVKAREKGGKASVTVASTHNEMQAPTQAAALLAPSTSSVRLGEPAAISRETSTKDIIAAAIRELELARDILTGTPSKIRSYSATSSSRDARS